LRTLPLVANVIGGRILCIKLAGIFFDAPFPIGSSRNMQRTMFTGYKDGHIDSKGVFMSRLSCFAANAIHFFRQGINFWATR
jgi:hypothetical protein